jgi:hypothetical protein
MGSRPSWQHWNMPVTSFPEYANTLTDTILELVATGQARLLDLQVDQRSTLRGFLAGIIVFEDESQLHFREFIDVTQAELRLMYAYHYQDAETKLIFRYDNARHRPSLPQREHKHTLEGIEPGISPTLAQVIDEIMQR